MTSTLLLIVRGPLAYFVVFWFVVFLALCTNILACNLHVFFPFFKCVEGEGGEGGATEVAEGVAAAEGGEGAAVVGEGGEVQADAPPAWSALIYP